jgi:hypothetical protein
VASSGLPDGLFSIKISNLAQFCWVLQCKMLVYFTAIWYMLWSFGIFSTLHQEKSANPGRHVRDQKLFFLRGSVIPFPVGFCYRQVAVLLWLLGITVIISPPYH